MQEQTYNRVINGCFIVVIVSMFFSEQSGEWREVVFAVGLFAGLIALFVYLYDQWHHEEENSSSVEEEDTTDLPLAHHGIRPEALVAADPSKERTIRVTIRKRAPRSANLYYLFEETSGYQRIRAGQPEWKRDIFDEVVRMADRLPLHEFEINRDGRIIARPSGKTRKVGSDERTQREEHQGIDLHSMLPSSKVLH